MENEKFIDSSEINEIVKNLTLFDDYFMSVIFDKNIPATQMVLRTILGKQDIKVKSVTGQRTLKNPLTKGRSLKLDVLAEDESGKNYNIEIQRGSKGAIPKRARFHSSMLDSRMLKAGQKFNRLTESYIIFITEKDYYKQGLPIYTVNRVVEETGLPFGDGSHIIYVNGSYKGNDAMGRLMQDFRETNPDTMYNKELIESVEHFSADKEENMSMTIRAYGRKIARLVREEVTKEVTEEVTREVTEEVTKEVTEEVTKKVTKKVSLEREIKAGIAYGIDKTKIIARLCSEFNMSEKDANKEYDKYVVETV